MHEGILGRELRGEAARREERGIAVGELGKHGAADQEVAVERGAEHVHGFVHGGAEGGGGIRADAAAGIEEGVEHELARIGLLAHALLAAEHLEAVGILGAEQSEELGAAGTGAALAGGGGGHTAFGAHGGRGLGVGGNFGGLRRARSAPLRSAGGEKSEGTDQQNSHDGLLQAPQATVLPQYQT